MEMQGIPVTMANLAIHRQKEEEMNQERMRYYQILQEATAQQAREANKGKAREVVPDSEEEDSEELASSSSEECFASSARRLACLVQHKDNQKPTNIPLPQQRRQKRDTPARVGMLSFVVVLKAPYPLRAASGRFKRGVTGCNQNTE
ncbi:hypothetical protein PIB30_051018 [Stylosanthes scabra]|uniref:Uncharacterized protein n=1 Tax=Stylosanthes scabra TaxID=79078 RepID=A0ABU6WG65_9FABA|nr:hypothetical protein [Stylosanthes scabra]